MLNSLFTSRPPCHDENFLLIINTCFTFCFVALSSVHTLINAGLGKAPGEALWEGNSHSVVTGRRKHTPVQHPAVVPGPHGIESGKPSQNVDVTVRSGDSSSPQEVNYCIVSNLQNQGALAMRIYAEKSVINDLFVVLQEECLQNVHFLTTVN